MRHQMEYRYPSLFTEDKAFKTSAEAKAFDTEMAAGILGHTSVPDIIAAATLTDGSLRKALIFLGEVAGESRSEAKS